MTPFLEVINELVKDFEIVDRDATMLELYRESDGLRVCVDDQGVIRDVPRVGKSAFPYGVAPCDCSQFATPDVARAAREYVDPATLDRVIIRLAERVCTEIESGLTREATLCHLEQAIRSLKGQA